MLTSDLQLVKQQALREIIRKSKNFTLIEFKILKVIVLVKLND